MMSEWLAAQQREDGSWERPGGYCGNHYDTGWAGLALMATGNPKYDPVIKKAAHYIAFSGSQCWWAVPQASAGIFLCEYWLRYRDNSVLPAIRNGVQRMKTKSFTGTSSPATAFTRATGEQASASAAPTCACSWRWPANPGAHGRRCAGQNDGSCPVHLPHRHGALRPHDGNLHL